MPPPSGGRLPTAFAECGLDKGLWGAALFRGALGATNQVPSCLFCLPTCPVLRANHRITELRFWSLGHLSPEAAYGGMKGLPHRGRAPGRMGQKVLSDPSGLGNLLQAGDEGLQWWEHPCNPSQRANPPSPAPRCENSGCSSKKFPLTGLGLSPSGSWTSEHQQPKPGPASIFPEPAPCRQQAPTLHPLLRNDQVL